MSYGMESITPRVLFMVGMHKGMTKITHLILSRLFPLFKRYEIKMYFVWPIRLSCLTTCIYIHTYICNLIISIDILFIIQIFFWHIPLSFSKCLFFSLLAFFYYPSYFSFISTLLILRWNNKIFLTCPIFTLKGEWNARKLDPSYSIPIPNQPPHHNLLIQ